jgi:cytochrome c-type biogenesis protein CcmH/NrfF
VGHVRATWALAVVIVALAAPSAWAAQTSLADVEDEVMCVQCKTPLDQSHAPAAERERAFIRRGIAAGQSKQQIKDGLVAQFGPAVLAEPQDSGFGLAAWLVPIVAALAALVALLLAARRWRRTAAPVAADAGADSPEPLEDADAWRLDRELSAFDKRGRA